ncbi:MAG: hypothetical protein JAY72_19425 [Candidatus Thiodiazotropha endolucinida]|nr:hypothetical protein [Candidatus Thiodiazotropha taylori]MCW4323854.1 hypothetical protein [Candidatus Thiodiazotropha taylori]
MKYTVLIYGVILGISISAPTHSDDFTPKEQSAINRLEDLREKLGKERTTKTRTTKVYKCKEGNKTTFSDKPCNDNLEIVDIKASKGEYKKRSAEYNGEAKQN